MLKADPDLVAAMRDLLEACAERRRTPEQKPWVTPADWIPEPDEHGRYMIEYTVPTVIRRPFAVLTVGTVMSDAERKAQQKAMEADS